MKKGKSIRSCILAIAVILFFGCNPSKKWNYLNEISLQDITPVGITQLNGHLWISDAKNNRLVSIDSNGQIVKVHDGFQRPMHISEENNKIYVPEFLTDSIKIINGDNVEVLELTEVPDAPAAVDVKDNITVVADFYNHRIILQHHKQTVIIGEEGHIQGELYYPTDVALYENKIFVADAYNNRIQIFDLQGNSLQVIGDKNNIQVAMGLTVNSNELFVVDFDGNRLLIYDFDGNLKQVLNKGLNNPSDVVLVRQRLYIVNYGSNSISVYGKT